MRSRLLLFLVVTYYSECPALKFVKFSLKLHLNFNFHVDSDRTKSFSWDALTLDVQYPTYNSKALISVRGVFLPLLVKELEENGRTHYLEDPHGTMWAVLDRAAAELTALTNHYYNQLQHHPQYQQQSSSTSADHKAPGVPISSLLLGSASTAMTQQCEDGSSGGDLDNLLLFLKVMLLLLARY
jgi:hypothetical protein